MVDPITVTTAGAIVQAAFQAFLNSETGKASMSEISEAGAEQELTEKRSPEKELTQMGELRQKIWGRLRLKSRKMQVLATAIAQTQQVTLAQMDAIAAYLRVEMNYDDRFATELKQLAERIEQELKGESPSQTVMARFGWQQAKQFTHQNIHPPIPQRALHHAPSAVPQP